MALIDKINMDILMPNPFEPEEMNKLYIYVDFVKAGMQNFGVRCVGHKTEFINTRDSKKVKPAFFMHEFIMTGRTDLIPNCKYFC